MNLKDFPRLISTKDIKPGDWVGDFARIYEFECIGFNPASFDEKYKYQVTHIVDSIRLEIKYKNIFTDNYGLCKVDCRDLFKFLPKKKEYNHPLTRIFV